MKNFKNETINEMKKLKSEYKIDLLQDLRHALQTEINAYKDEFKFLIKKPKKNFSLIIEWFVFTQEFAKFKQKLKFVNALLKDELSKRRLELRNERI